MRMDGMDKYKRIGFLKDMIYKLNAFIAIVIMQFSVDTELIMIIY